MAYGVNAPFGLRPFSSISGGSWTEKVNEYLITPGYGISIFTGDLVIPSPSLATINTIQLYTPIYTQTAGNNPNTFTQTTPVLGVFMGCEYLSTATATNNLIKSPYWPANTQVQPGTLVKAYVLDDPDVVYDAQISTVINAAVAANGVIPFAVSPNFPVDGAGTPANSAGIGSNFSIMGGGGINFNTIQLAGPPIVNAGYNNNPVSTMVGVADNNPVTVFGINPYGGSTTTGQSGAYVCGSTAGSNNAGNTTFSAPGLYNLAKEYDHTVATLPLKVVGYTPNINNVAAQGLTLQTTPFLNVRVVINNHVYRPGTPGQTFAA